MATQPVKTLSGGQKNRLMLARVLANPGRLLILDEPTNDLDMETLDMLEEILANYNGTLIIVSHDRDFLDQTVTKIMSFEGDGNIDMTIGGYSDYLIEKKERERAADPVRQRADATKANKPKPEIKKAPKKLTYKLQHELENLPLKISLLESDVKAFERRLSDPDLYKKNHNQFQDLTKKLNEAKEELAKSEHRWLELDEMRQAAL